MPGKGYGARPDNVRRRRKAPTPPARSGVLVKRARFLSRICQGCGEPIEAGALIVNYSRPPLGPGLPPVVTYVHSDPPTCLGRLVLARGELAYLDSIMARHRASLRRHLHGPVRPSGAL